MTKAKVNALLDAFLAAKAASQEELWRASHPEAPDGATVLAVWLIITRQTKYHILIRALSVVDIRCALRMAIYAAIIAHPLWDNYCGKVGKKHRAAPLAAIRAAIACSRNPTEDNLWACRAAAGAARAAALQAAVNASAYAAAHAAALAASEAADAAAGAARAAINAYSHAALAVVYAARAASDQDAVINAIIAAMADHYEGRPLEML